MAEEVLEEDQVGKTGVEVRSDDGLQGTGQAPEVRELDEKRSLPPARCRGYEDRDIAECEGKVRLRRPGPGPELCDDEADRVGEEH